MKTHFDCSEYNKESVSCQYVTQVIFVVSMAHYSIQINKLHMKGSALRCRLPGLGSPNEDISRRNCARDR